MSHWNPLNFQSILHKCLRSISLTHWRIFNKSGTFNTRWPAQVAARISYSCDRFQSGQEPTLTRAWTRWVWKRCLPFVLSLKACCIVQEKPDSLVLQTWMTTTIRTLFSPLFPSPYTLHPCIKSYIWQKHSDCEENRGTSLRWWKTPDLVALTLWNSWKR